MIKEILNGFQSSRCTCSERCILGDDQETPLQGTFVTSITNDCIIINPNFVDYNQVNNDKFIINIQTASSELNSVLALKLKE